MPLVERPALLDDLAFLARRQGSEVELFDGDQRVFLAVIRQGERRAALFLERTRHALRATPVLCLAGLILRDGVVHEVQVDFSMDGERSTAFPLAQPDQLLTQLGVGRMPIEGIPAWLDSTL